MNRWRRAASSAGASGPILGGLIPHAGYLTDPHSADQHADYTWRPRFTACRAAEARSSISTCRRCSSSAQSTVRRSRAGQWWRLVTAGFLHGGILHILMNSWVLFDLGAQVEEIYGGARMLVIYFVANIVGLLRKCDVAAGDAVGGRIGRAVRDGRARCWRSASGIAAAMGDMVRSVYGRYLVYLLLFSLLPGVDMAAHIGGLAGGFGVAYVAGRPEYEGSPVERVWKLGAGGVDAGYAVLLPKVVLVVQQRRDNKIEEHEISYSGAGSGAELRPGRHDRRGQRRSRPFIRSPRRPKRPRRSSGRRPPSGTRPST